MKLNKKNYWPLYLCIYDCMRQLQKCWPLKWLKCSETWALCQLVGLLAFKGVIKFLRFPWEKTAVFSHLWIIVNAELNRNTFGSSRNSSTTYLSHNRIQSFHQKDLMQIHCNPNLPKMTYQITCKEMLRCIEPKLFASAFKPWLG